LDPLVRLLSNEVQLEGIFKLSKKIQMVETMEMRESAEVLESLSEPEPGLEQGLEPVSSRVAGIPGSRQQIIYNIETNLEAVYKAYGEPQVIRVRENNPNRSRRSGLVVRIEASTVSFTDCLIRRNITKDFFRAADLPNSPGVDFVGIVVYAGDLAMEEDGFRVGDRVGCVYQFLGGNARFVSLPAKYCVEVPHDLNACEATCLMRSYLAAIQILYRVGGSEGKIEEGDKVLVTGANGSMGRAVIELAKLSGAKVYASCRREHKDFIKNTVGADVWLDEDPGMWQNLEMDIVVDLVCFTGDFRDTQLALADDGVKMVCAGKAKQERDEISLQQAQNEEFNELYAEKTDSFEYLAMGGLCGLHVGVPQKEDIYEKAFLPGLCGAVLKEVPTPWSSTVLEYDLFESIEERPDLMAEDLELLFSLLRENKIRPIIARIVGLDDVVKAHSYIEGGATQGTIVCQP